MNQLDEQVEKQQQSVIGLLAVIIIIGSVVMAVKYVYGVIDSHLETKAIQGSYLEHSDLLSRELHIDRKCLNFKTVTTDGCYRETLFCGLSRVSLAFYEVKTKQIRSKPGCSLSGRDSPEQSDVTQFTIRKDGKRLFVRLPNGVEEVYNEM